MEHDFWHTRWRSGRTGFHLQRVNPHLKAQRGILGTPVEGARVLVPLCGMTLDLGWLVQQGHAVTGVELSEIACRSVLQQRQAPAAESTDGPFTRFDAEGLCLLCGDYFELDSTRLGPVSAVWDRASLIALPPEMRQRYAKQQAALLQPGTPTLLVTLEYPEGEMSGPPFSVREPEVRQLFEANFEVERLGGQDALTEEPKFAELGLTALDESIYRLVRR